jgi:dihydrofolate reductase
MSGATKKMISQIVVIGKNKAIGCKNRLLWNIPEDMARFKKITTGHPIVMGRKTYESIGRPLPGRTNIIISRNKDLEIKGCLTTDSLESALKIAKESPGSDEIFIIGGGQIFEESLGISDKLYLTVVDDEPPADTYFPDYSVFQKKFSDKKARMAN